MVSHLLSYERCSCSVANFLREKNPLVSAFCAPSFCLVDLGRKVISNPARVYEAASCGSVGDAKQKVPVRLILPFSPSGGSGNGARRYLPSLSWPWYTTRATPEQQVMMLMISSGGLPQPVPQGQWFSVCCAAWISSVYLG